MKKSLVIFAFLLLAGLGFTVYFQSSLLSEKDQVTYVDDIIYGDASEVEGLTATIRSEYGRQLYWTTTYAAGENPDVNTDYTFYSSEQNYNYEMSNYIYMNFYFQDDFELGKNRSEFTSIGQALFDLYQETGDNETKIKKIALKDYYDYYPFEFSFIWDDYDEYWEWEEDYLTKYGYSTEDERYQDFQYLKNFFRIPIIEDDTITLELSKENGSLDYTSVYHDENEYYFSSYSAAADNGLYFTFVIDGQDSHNAFDDSLIPGGYGIYYIPCTSDAGVSDKADVQNMSMVYPLDKEDEILNFGVTADESKLILIYLENATISDIRENEAESRTVIEIIDTKTKELLQTIYLDGIPKADGSTEILIPYNIHSYDDFIAMDCSYDYLAVLALTEQDTYELAFVTNLREEGIFECYIDSQPATVMDWNGSQIAIAGRRLSNIADYYYYESCGFYLAVFDKDGLVYYSEHDSSLGRGEFPYGSETIQLLTDQEEWGLEVHWE